MRLLYMIVLILIPSLAFALEVDLQIGKRAPELSYLCWTPVIARVALSKPGNHDVSIDISSSTETGGQLTFDYHNGTDYPKASDFVVRDKLTVNLPKDGSWVKFLVAGKFGHPSQALHDAAIVISYNGDEERHSTTVRVRKNAENLTSQEWSNLLRAFAQLHNLSGGTRNSLFAKYPIVHGEAWSMAHFTPAFLPWHRAFILALERELQRIDPSVSLPYWKFEESAPSVFAPNTMGHQNNVRDSRVIFSTSPIAGWKFAGTLLTRLQGDSNLMADSLSVTPEARILRKNSTYITFYGALERGHHGTAHGRAGLLTSPLSPADPLFFLLHANVDRIWANWQQEKRMFDPTATEAYQPQGRYEALPVGSASRDKGNWSEDTLWPWDGDIDTSRGRAPLSSIDWRGYPVPSLIEYPRVDGLEPSQTPKVKHMIDYNSTLGLSAPLGFCYDDVPFK